jgi:hypothetical protein
MPAIHADLLESIAALPPYWHAAGCLPGDVLRAFVRHSGGHLRRSVETGAGKSTLLLSHISDHHTVFATNGGESVHVTQTSPLLNRATVEYVDGPTQHTLAVHSFTDPLDFVLIDGPHGYPFPELEYWHLYRHIGHGGLLVVDDIHIPTINALFLFLCEEAMFSLVEVVGTTAIFRRTSAPTFDPFCDGWTQQAFNTARFPVDVQIRPCPQPAPEPYRARLLPLIAQWKAAGTRVAVFGTGAHTDHLFAVVPELEGISLVAFLDSHADRQRTPYRGRPVMPPAWAEGHCEVVLCSSFAHELAQMAVLDALAVKVVPSHIQTVSSSARPLASAAAGGW